MARLILSTVRVSMHASVIVACKAESDSVLGFTHLLTYFRNPVLCHPPAYAPIRIRQVAE